MNKDLILLYIVLVILKATLLCILAAKFWRQRHERIGKALALFFAAGMADEVLTFAAVRLGTLVPASHNEWFAPLYFIGRLLLICSVIGLYVSVSFGRRAK